MKRGADIIKTQMQAIFNKYRADYSGAVLVKTGEETMLAAAAGYASKAFEIPNRPDTRFDTASVTKTFTAAAVMKLMEEGRLRLEDHIVALVDLSGTAIPGDVTIEHLLTHTSGIADDADEEAGEDYSALFIDKPNYAIRECRDFLPNFAYKPPRFKAGAGVRYNNCAFVLLGLAIEAVTGVSYREYVRSQVFSPCGMRQSHFFAMDEVNPHAAEGYVAMTDAEGRFVKWKKNIYSYPPIGTADGGAFTTVYDLDIFLRALLHGTWLSPSFSQMMCTPHSTHTRPHRYGTWRMGYAFEFIETDKHIFCMYKEGGNAGVDAICAYFPRWDLTVNMLSNQNGCLDNMYKDIQAYLFSLI